MGAKIKTGLIATPPVGGVTTAKSTKITVVRDIESLRAHTRAWRKNGETIGLVPTMGALHEGHLSLVQTALRECDRVVATIFVNPAQFAPTEDFEAYPRDEADDIAKLDRVKTDLLFAPDVAEMYAEGFSTSVTVSGITAGLCGASRPHFFGGVATVVNKLFMQSLPDRAYFGEKDYQQLQVIRRMVRDLDIPVQIVGVPTIRENDGLAMSSRNWYLTPEERAIAPLLHQTLQETAAAAAAGEPCEDATARGRATLARSGFARVDYLAICDAETLAPLEGVDRPARALVAAVLGSTRLIDNIPVPVRA
ncbi:MAG: pantoate--beta-alanine ligase [Alphaproteobacteria bacterium]